MKQDKKKSKAGIFGRMLLLFLEMMGIAAFLWGQEVLPASVTTPAFSWENYKTVAHALGGIGDKTYLNSKESFLASYQMGCRLFEVDLTKTSDGVWVCRHSWTQPMGQWEGDKARVLSEAEFLSSPIYKKYTPMTLADFLKLLKNYPDAFVMLDSKQYSVRSYQTTVEDYADYLEIAEAAGAEEVLDQIIPEIYTQPMFAGTALLYNFPTYIYSLWQEYSVKDLKKIASFCKEKGIPAATVYYKYWSEDVQDIFDKKGIKLYIYTVNDLKEAKEYMQKGAAGICSDYLQDRDLNLDKKDIDKHEN